MLFFLMSFCGFGVGSAGLYFVKTMPFYCHIFLDYLYTCMILTELK